jgi:hypothetical protein
LTSVSYFDNLTLQHIPVFMKWLEYLSYHHHGYRLLLKVQYESTQEIDCGAHKKCTPIGESAALNGIALGGGLQEVLALLGMIVFYRVVAYLGLRRYS